LIIGILKQIIIENIRARALFLLLLTPPVIEHCIEKVGWLRREIKLALYNKNIITPIFLEDFELEISLAKNIFQVI